MNKWITILSVVAIILLSGVASAISKSECNALPNEAEKYIEKSDWWMAGTHYRDACRCNGASTDIGREYCNKGLPYAIKSFEESAGPTRGNGRYDDMAAKLVADLYREMGDYDNAIVWYEKMMEVTKENGFDVITEYMMAGRCYYDKGNIEKACEYCKIANENNKIAYPKEGSLYDCAKEFGCKGPTVSGGGTLADSKSGGTSGSGEELPLIPIAIVAVILIIAAAVFLIKRKK